MKARKSVSGFRMIFGFLGVFLILIGFLTALPLIILIPYPEEVGAALPFSITAGSDIVIGLILYFLFLFKRHPEKFKRHEESQLLTLIWIFAIISGAMPFVIASGSLINMNFSKAIFESASSYTGTGLTGFGDYIDVYGAFAPHVFTYHRSQMQFIGGVGLVLLVASILGANAGVKLYVSEGHSDKLLPNIAKSAKLIFGIYILYSFLGTIALHLAGLPWFEAVCTSMCALSGGGMSPRAGNIGSYRLLEGTKIDGCFFPVNSLAVEIVVMVLVVLGMISFVLHTFILRGKFKTFFKDCETVYIAITGFIGVVVSYLGAVFAASATLGNFDFNGGQIFRDVIFYVVGSFTTSGFAVTGPGSSYHLIAVDGAIALGKPLLFVCTLLMLVGAGAGSTGGGIKQFRLVIAIKELAHSYKHRMSASNQITPNLIYRYGEVREIDDETAKEAKNYILYYLGVFLASVTILCFNPWYNVESAAFDVASSMGNVGLGLIDYTVVPKSFVEFMPFWVLSLDMLLGRLEIMPIFYAIRNLREEAAYQLELKRAAKAERQTIIE